MTEQPAGRGRLAPRRPGDEGAGQPFPESPEKRNDLWHEAKMFDYGPEDNLKLWEQATGILDSFVEVAAKLGVSENDALIHAMIDARERAREEIRRAGAEVQMRKEWAERQPKEADLL